MQTKSSGDIPTKDKKQAKKQRIDFMGIITMTVTLVSFLVAITFSGSIATNLVAFVIPLSHWSYFSCAFHQMWKSE